MIFFNSTRFTLIPQGSVATSSDTLILSLIVSLDVNVWSNSRSPMIFLNVVAVKFSIAMIGFSTPYAKNLGSVIWKNTTVSILIVTLSFVITGCGAKSTTCSFKITFLATLSIIGTLKCIPTDQVHLYPQSRSITNACVCGTILIHDDKSIRITTMIATVAINPTPTPSVLLASNILLIN